MQRSYRLELSVGLFVLLGVLAMLWLSLRFAGMEMLSGNHQMIHANFTSITGLKQGAAVEISGVRVGYVKTIDINPGDYEAEVLMSIRKDIPIPEDTIASIRTKGIIGERYVKISPGGSSTALKSEGRIVQTEPAINFEELISQFIHGSIR